MHFADVVFVTRAKTYTVPNAQFVGRVSFENELPATETMAPPRSAAEELGATEVTWGIEAIPERIPRTYDCSLVYRATDMCTIILRGEALKLLQDDGDK